MPTINDRISTDENGWHPPAFSQSIELLKPIDAQKPKLDVRRENEILKKIGFGFYDIEKAFKENLSNSYGSRDMDLFKAYIDCLDKNLNAGTPVCFFGANGSGKTNGMATLAREIIRKKFDPDIGVDGGVGLSMLLVTAYEMIEDFANNQLGSDNIYNIVRLLMVDDVDRDYTGHRRTALQYIIGERTKQQGKSFFLTTAMSNNEFAALLPHVFSRLKNGIVLKTKNIDLRSPRKGE